MKLHGTIDKLRQGEKITLVALGDSLTSGWLVERGYVDFIGQWIEENFRDATLSLINRGIPGDTASDGLARIKRDVLDLHPDLVFIQFGLNDAYMGISTASFAATLQAMIREIDRFTQAEILLITSIYMQRDEAENEIMARYYQELIDCAETNHLAVARVHEYWRKQISREINFSSLVQADGIHPTVAGYRMMAEAVWQLFK